MVKKKRQGFYTNNKKDSVWKYYGENDTLIAEEQLQKHKKNGVWKTYYNNGTINQVITYVNGYGMDIGKCIFTR